MAKRDKPISVKDALWTFSTNFCEGFPYGIIRSVSSVFFRDMKVSLESIGLTTFFGLPWILKFLWGPLVDEYSTKRRWIISTQSVILGIILASAFAAPLSFAVPAIAVMFFIGAFFTATQDIAIDGYYMEALDKEGQAKYVGMRVMAFRAAWMANPLIIATIGLNISWALAFFTAAVIYGLFFLYHIFFLKEVQAPTKGMKELYLKALKPKSIVFIVVTSLAALSIRLFFQSEFYESLKTAYPILAKFRFSHWVGLLLLLSLVLVGLFRNSIKKLIVKNADSFYGKAFLLFMERKKVKTILFFIIALRAGEWTLAVMVSPMFVDMGLKIHYGWISGFGLPCSIVGALLGGWMISRFGLKKVIWPFILAQNLTNLIYMILAFHMTPFLIQNTGNENPVGVGILNLVFVAGVHGFDQFASGLGTAVLITYLMRICHKEYKAAHYAIGTGLMNLSALFAGVLSGMIAGWLGYAWLFGISFFISMPAMLAIPFLPYLSEKNGGTET